VAEINWLFKAICTLVISIVVPDIKSPKIVQQKPVFNLFKGAYAQG
tara:strand:+ start:2914 stop:3051 length:138 start_codon:yes stop_codon:yes gene_type:complete